MSLATNTDSIAVSQFVSVSDRNVQITTLILSDEETNRENEQLVYLKPEKNCGKK